MSSQIRIGPKKLETMRLRFSRSDKGLLEMLQESRRNGDKNHIKYLVVLTGDSDFDIRNAAISHLFEAANNPALLDEISNFSAAVAEYGLREDNEISRMLAGGILTKLFDGGYHLCEKGRKVLIAYLEIGMDSGDSNIKEWASELRQRVA